MKGNFLFNNLFYSLYFMKKCLRSFIYLLIAASRARGHSASQTGTHQLDLGRHH
jgi:hypothetical protein